MTLVPAGLARAGRQAEPGSLVAGLVHPHIVPVFDSGDAIGRLWYVMPYIRGESLRARLERDGMLRVPDVHRITQEVAEALDCAHRHGVVHRDMKPLLAEGQALLGDFGIARETACHGRNLLPLRRSAPPMPCSRGRWWIVFRS